MVNINKKSLIIDSSGVRPFVFAETELGLGSGTLGEFADYVGLDLCSCNTTISEFSFAYNFQPSLFNVPLATSILSGIPHKNISISLSNVGYFSLTGGDVEQFSIQTSKINTNRQGRLWESSPHWESLSSQDKDAITLALSKSKTYDEVVILTNDWHLRQQCLDYEGISTYGSCSMLAGIVLTGFINYQKGTYIYQEWLNEEPHWIPYIRNEYGIKRKLKFGEVLAIERRRMRKGNSFWSLPKRHGSYLKVRKLCPY